MRWSNDDRNARAHRDGVRGRHIADVRLNRPEKHNAIGGGLLHEIVATAAALRERDDVRVIVLRGEGPSFCVGLDTADLAAMGSGDLDGGSDGMDDNYTG